MVTGDSKEEPVEETPEAEAVETPQAYDVQRPAAAASSSVAPPSEVYPMYVLMKEGENGELIELPTQADGSLLLSTVTAHFSEDVVGLRYNSESGSLRGVRVTGKVINPPPEGWGKIEYLVVLDNKRKLCGADDPEAKRRRKTKDMLGDLVVLGLPYTTTEDDLRTYFSQYGELTHCEIKVDQVTKKSKGFGFIRFKEVEAVEEAVGAVHVFNGRNCEVRFPKKTQTITDNIPTKLFIGRLPPGTTKEDLEECFSEFGPLEDIFVPDKFRGYGFVTFPSQGVAREVMKGSYVLKGHYLNVAYPNSPNLMAQQRAQGMQSMGRPQRPQRPPLRGEIQRPQQQQKPSSNPQRLQQPRNAILPTPQPSETSQNTRLPTPQVPYGYGNMQQMPMMAPFGAGYGNPFGNMGQFGNNMNYGGYPWMPGFYPPGGSNR